MKLLKMQLQKAQTPDEKGSLVEYMVVEHQISQSQVCKVVSLPSNTVRYKPVPNNDYEIINELQSLISKHQSIGFCKRYYRIRRIGYAWNHKRVWRVYTELKLNIRRRFKKPLPASFKAGIIIPRQC